GGDAVRLLRRNEVKGPPPCCGSGGASLCAASWPTTCSAVFDACPNGVPDASTPDPAACSAGATSATSAGANTSAGASTSAGATSAGATTSGSGTAGSTGSASNTGSGTSASTGTIDSASTGNAKESDSSSGCSLRARGYRAWSREASFVALALLAG